MKLQVFQETELWVWRLTDSGGMILAVSETRYASRSECAQAARAVLNALLVSWLIENAI